MFNFYTVLAFLKTKDSDEQKQKQQKYELINKKKQKL